MPPIDAGSSRLDARLNKATQLLKKRDDISSSKVGGIKLTFIPDINDFLFSFVRWTPSAACAAACGSCQPQVCPYHFNTDDYAHFDLILLSAGNLINYPFLCYVTENPLLTASDFDRYWHLAATLLATTLNIVFNGTLNSDNARQSALTLGIWGFEVLRYAKNSQ